MSNERLLSAALKGDAVEVGRLLQDGADPNTRGRGGVTALHRAAWQGHAEICTLLLDRGAEIDALDEDEESATNYAIRYGRFDIARLLIEKGADVRVTDNKGTTLLHTAVVGEEPSEPASTQTLDLVRLLVCRGANINATVREGRMAGLTPLNLSVGLPKGTALVRLLLELGADATIADAEGRTPLTIARMQEDEALVGVLQGAGRSGEAGNVGGAVATTTPRSEPRNDTPPPASSCVIATACLGEASERIASLRKLRDDAISNDPIARDFFHVFWSRYYEWSPGVARIASADPAVAQHIRWGFLEPWLAWMDLVTRMGRRGVDNLSEQEKKEILQSLGLRIGAWIDQVPGLMESKRPETDDEVFEAFESFRAGARAGGGGGS